jgi:hypothetical protein
MNYAHDSSVGFGNFSGNTVLAMNIVRGCEVTAMAGVTGCAYLYNTLFGGSSPRGNGISGTNNNTMVIIGNVISGFVNGIISTTAAYKNNVIDYNNIYNCTTPYTNVDAGPNDIALDPEFTSAGNTGSDLCTNGTAWTGATGSTPPTGWAVVTAGTFTITASGQAGDYLKIAHNGTNNNPEISFAITTEVGKPYRITYYAQKGTATNATAKVGTTSGGTEIGYSVTHTDTDWNTQKSVSYEATATTTYFSVGATTSTSGQYAMIDTVTIYEQGEDFTPGDNMKLDIDWTKVGL